MAAAQTLTLEALRATFHEKKAVQLKAIQSEACGLFRVTRTLFPERR